MRPFYWAGSAHDTVGMSEIDNVFLTDTRREVLNGEYEGSDSNRRTHKSNIKKRAKIALAELISVAQSPVIENGDIFKIRQILELYESILWDGGRLQPYQDFEGSRKEYRYCFGHQTGLNQHMDNTAQNYQRLLHQDPFQPRGLVSERLLEVQDGVDTQERANAMLPQRNE